MSKTTHLEAASVNSEHGNPKERESEGLRDGEEHVHKEGGVVPAPMTGPFSGAGECGATYYERAFTGHSGEKGVVGCVQDLVTVEVVDVIFECAVMMGSVRRDSMYCEVTLYIVDHVWRVINVSNAWRWGRTEVVHGCG